MQSQYSSFSCLHIMTSSLPDERHLTLLPQGSAPNTELNPQNIIYIYLYEKINFFAILYTYYLLTPFFAAK